MGASFVARLALILAVLALLLQVFAALVRFEPHTRAWLRAHTPEWVQERRIAKGLPRLEADQPQEQQTK